MADRATPFSMTGNQRKFKIIPPDPTLEDDPDNKYTDYWEQLKSHGNGEYADCASIKLDAWLKREIPPRNYLLGHILCTTSRCLLIGDTGVGKTLFGLEIAGATAAGKRLLGWAGRGRARVIYLDGEIARRDLKGAPAAHRGPLRRRFGSLGLQSRHCRNVPAQYLRGPSMAFPAS